MSTVKTQLKKIDSLAREYRRKHGTGFGGIQTYWSMGPEDVEPLRQACCSMLSLDEQDQFNAFWRQVSSKFSMLTGNMQGLSLHAFTDEELDIMEHWLQIIEARGVKDELTFMFDPSSFDRSLRAATDFIYAEWGGSTLE